MFVCMITVFSQLIISIVCQAKKNTLPLCVYLCKYTIYIMYSYNLPSGPILCCILWTVGAPDQMTVSQHSKSDR